MGSLNDDIKYLDTILNGENEDQFGFLYSRTNENLIRFFDEIDVKDQDVYTVLASSDLFFSLIANSVNHIDSFDIQPISNRYYHLRKWLLYCKLISAAGVSIRVLSNIINAYKSYSVKEEQESAIFWEYYLNRIDTTYFYSSILFEPVDNPKVSYQDKIGKILERLNQINPKFDYIDICSELDLEKDRKYDKVFLSNVLDYNRKPEKLEIVCNNMLKLLKEKGAVICTHMDDYGSIDIERDIFSSKFNYHEIFVDKDRAQDVTYYQYSKK